MNKSQKINSADKGILHQWLQGVLFALYAWNVGPVDGTDIAQSVVDIGIKLPFPIELSTERSRGVLQKEIKTWITLRLHPHLYLDK